MPQTNAVQAVVATAPDPAPPSASPQQHVVTDLTKATWKLGAIIVCCAFGLLAFLWGIKTDVQDLHGDFKLLDHRVTALEKWAKDPKIFPATGPVPSSSGAPSPSQSLGTDASAGPTQAYVAPPACIDNKRQVPIDCHGAENCTTGSGLKPSFVDKWQRRTGASAVYLCSEKTR